MPKKPGKEVKALTSVGEVAFLVGILLAVVSVFLPEEVVNQMIVRAVLSILGFIVGILNIRREETIEFLLAALIIMLPGFTIAQLKLPLTIENILSNIAIFVWPASLIVSLAAIWRLASKR